MNDQAANVAVAEFCGWKFHPESDVSMHVESAYPECWTHNEYEKVFKLPDYGRDLNAMADAWSLLNEKQREEFQKNIRFVILGVDQKALVDLSWTGEGRIANATASQRREALLRTIGKWEDGE